MATIKTAISIDRSLFAEINKLAHETHLSRSQIFSQAVQHLVGYRDNLALFKKLNEAYGSEVTPDEIKHRKYSKKAALRLLKDTWK